MSESANRATLEALVAALNASDLEGLDRVFADDVVMEWPQSGERIVGGHDRHEIYGRFPSLPQVTPRRMTGSDDLWVLEASLDYGDGDPFQCVFIFEMRDGLIAKETGYWSQPFPAPDWRAPGSSDSRGSSGAPGCRAGRRGASHGALPSTHEQRSTRNDGARG